MAYTLVHHDLIRVPRGQARYGIYWLRVYADGAGHVAVVTEVPGNPGPSVINASELVVSEIEQLSGVEPGMLTSYLVMPSGAGGGTGPSAWLVHVRPEMRWDEVSIGEIEATLGQPLAVIPQHEELLRRVVALGGELEDEIYEPVFEAVPVGDLPPPHLPFRCAFADRFKTMKDQLGNRDLTVNEVVALGERFLASLTAEERGACRFHAADWRSIADESVGILGASRSRDPAALTAAAQARSLPPVEKRWLQSLFQDPLVVHEHSFGDGQHRGCALRFSGATHAPVVRAFAMTRGEPGVWIYTGDG